MLEVDALDAWYGRAQVLHGLSFGVGAGECVALTGANGAGKSTAMKAVMGLVARRGRVRFDANDISSLPTWRISRLGLGWVPEDRRIFTDLSVRENLAVGARPAAPGTAGWTEARLFDLFPSLAAMADRLAAHMSGGEQQMLTIARTLRSNPRLLLLDEPSEGLAPVVVEQIAAMILALKRDGLAILLAEQNVHFARLVADRAVVLEKGEVRADAPVDEIVCALPARRPAPGA